MVSSLYYVTILHSFLCLFSKCFRSAFDSFFSDFPRLTFPEFKFPRIDFDFPSFFSPKQLKYDSPGPVEHEFPWSFSKRSIEIATDQGYDTIRFKGGLQEQVLEIYGSLHLRNIEVTGTIGDFFLNIRDSNGDRHVYLRNPIGANTIRVDRSSKKRFLTITSSSGTIKKQYCIPPDTSAYVCTSGPTEDYIIKVTGITGVEKLQKEFASAPVAPRVIRLSEYHRPGAFAKSGHDTELQEVDQENNVTKTHIFMNPDVKIYTKEELEKKLGHRVDSSPNIIVNEKRFINRSSPNCNKVVVNQTTNIFHGGKLS